MMHIFSIRIELYVYIIFQGKNADILNTKRHVPSLHFHYLAKSGDGLIELQCALAWVFVNLKKKNTSII